MGQFADFWCRYMHSRAEKAFSLPTPHPQGQEFRVRCGTCGRVYSVIRPDGWTSPWRKKACIIHNDREDPVHEFDGQWWHWDVARSTRRGPFTSEHAAREACERYSQEEGSWTNSEDNATKKPKHR